MLNMNMTALSDTLEQLDEAAQDHLEWHANLLRAFVCRLPGDSNDFAPDAHRLCRFGQWYYERAAVELRNHPGFQAIGAQHLRVHNVAAAILRGMQANQAVDRRAFNEFMVGGMLMRRHIELLRRELLAALRCRDALTGAYHRTEVLPELRRRREVVKHGAETCVIVLMDIDRLREVNETHGHQIGDALLAESVRLVREQLRADDRVFRYGGDEFLVVLPGADLTVGQAVVARIREALVRRQLFVTSTPLPLTASFGLALLDPADRVEDSIDRSAQALLLAKTAGGNRAISWDTTVTTSTRWRRLRVDRGDVTVDLAGIESQDPERIEGEDA